MLSISCSLRAVVWAMRTAFLIVSPLRPIAASRRLTRGDWAYHKLTYPSDPLLCKQM